MSLLSNVLQRLRRNPRLIPKAIAILFLGGARQLAWELARLSAAGDKKQYESWVRDRGLSADYVAHLVDSARRLPHRPLMSIMMPVDAGTDPQLLTESLRSVAEQVYSRWELSVLIPASAGEALRGALDAAGTAETNVRISEHPGRLDAAAALARALDEASGEFALFLSPGDLLHPTSLYEVAAALNEDPRADIVYSDEDCVSANGERARPLLKPDWSPDLALVHGYTSRLCAYRLSRVRALGGLRLDLTLEYEHDLVLRLTECGARPRHVPQLLYSRRESPTADEAGKAERGRVLEAAIARRRLCARVETDSAPGGWRVRYELLGEPRIAIIVPSGGNLSVLRENMRSVASLTTYPSYEYVLADNSTGDEVRALWDSMAEAFPAGRYLEIRDKPFNYAAINNFAVAHTDAPFLVFLNDDTRVISPDWLECLLEHAQRPEVGAVGAKLHYPDRRIQHAGVVLHRNGPANAFCGWPADGADHGHLVRSVRNCSAVTFACAMLRRSVFHEVGGLDAVAFPVAFNDVDICLRIGARGYRIVYTPYASLYHHESLTRGPMQGYRYIERLRERWGHVLGRDPFYNPNFEGPAPYSLF